MSHIGRPIPLSGYILRYKWDVCQIVNYCTFLLSFHCVSEGGLEAGHFFHVNVSDAVHMSQERTSLLPCLQ